MLPEQIAVIMLAAHALEAPMDADLIADRKHDTEEERKWTLPS
jgi:hypothetical protein